MPWMTLGLAEKLPDCDLAPVATGGGIAFMPDDCVPALRVVPEKPPIAVWARVKFSHGMKLLHLDAAGSGVSFNRSIAPAISRP
jgi:hypothetical protein